MTGADSDIRRAVAIVFAREDADVMLSYLEEEEADVREVVTLIQDCGRKAIAQPGDIGSSTYTQSLVETAIHEVVGLDAVVNNAAFQIINTTSIQIFQPGEELIAYATTKRRSPARQRALQNSQQKKVYG